MNTLKLIGLTLVQMAKQVFSFPVTVANGIRRMRGQTEAEEREAERLDRIRNPSKYLGK